MSNATRATLRGVLRELLEGTLGTVRPVPSGAFKYAEFIDHPLEKQQQIARETTVGRNWFHIAFMGRQDNPSSAMSANGNRRIADQPFRIEIIRYLLSRAADEERDEDRDAFADDLDYVAAALACPHQMSLTSGGVATGIVSGRVNPRAEVTPRIITSPADWAQHLQRARLDSIITLDLEQ